MTTSGCIGRHIRKDGRVGNRFYEPRAKDRSWDSEDNVRIPTLARERISRGQEVGLGDVAAGGVSSPGDHEEVVHFAVAGPVGLRLNRASRIGPFCVMNQGTVFFAPFKVATSIWGFRAGLDPPAFGCEWQERHWFELKRGPRPLFAPLVTTSTSANLASPSWKNAASSAVRPLSGVPAPAGPPRTPGSTGPDLV